MKTKRIPVAEDPRVTIAHLEDRLRRETARAEAAEANARLAWRLASWGGPRRQDTIGTQGRGDDGANR